MAVVPEHQEVLVEGMFIIREHQLQELLVKDIRVEQPQHLQDYLVVAAVVLAVQEVGGLLITVGMGGLD